MRSKPNETDSGMNGISNNEIFLWLYPGGVHVTLGRGRNICFIKKKHTTFIVFKVDSENKSIMQPHGTIGHVLLLILLCKALNGKDLAFGLLQPPHSLAH